MHSYHKVNAMDTQLPVLCVQMEHMHVFLVMLQVNRTLESCVDDEFAKYCVLIVT